MEGRSCIKPCALAAETAFGLNDDSWRMSAMMSQGSMLYFLVSRKMMES